MEILGQIIGYGIVIFFFVAFIGCLAFLWEACHYDLNEPIFKTEIKIRFKEADNEDDKDDKDEDRQ